MRRKLLSAGLGLTLCTTSLTLPAAAQRDDGPTATRTATATATTTTTTTTPQVRPVRDREPEVDVMTMSCQLRGLVAGCEWRPTSAPTAAVYQLWRIVDRGVRELVWRGGLDTTAARDELPAGSLGVRYAVLALDAEGNVVGQSRPSTLIVERDDDPDRPEIDVEQARPISRSLQYRTLQYR